VGVALVIGQIQTLTAGWVPMRCEDACGFPLSERGGVHVELGGEFTDAQRGRLRVGRLGHQS
jgi:hypothetical protein